MGQQATSFTTPAGRMIGGSLYTGKTTNKDGKPLVDKSGAARTSFEFGIAIPKLQGQTHWNQTPWGALIYNQGVADFGAAVANHPDFAWKITDGDAAHSKTPGGKPPRELEGYPGCWVLWYSGGEAPMIYNANGTERITAQNAVQPGFWISVFGNVKGNGNEPGNAGQKKSGVYLNHTYVAYLAPGEVISQRPDVSAAGFASVQLPPGVSAQPGAMVQPPAAYAPPPQQPIPVQPMQGMIPVAPPAAMPVAPPPAGPVMTAKANGFSYQQLISGGWTHQQLIDAGMIQ